MKTQITMNFGKKVSSKLVVKFAKIYVLNLVIFSLQNICTLEKKIQSVFIDNPNMLFYYKDKTLKLSACKCSLAIAAIVVLRNTSQHYYQKGQKTESSFIQEADYEDLSRLARGRYLDEFK